MLGKPDQPGPGITKNLRVRARSCAPFRVLVRLRREGRISELVTMHPSQDPRRYNHPRDIPSLALNAVYIVSNLFTCLRSVYTCIWIYHAKETYAQRHRLCHLASVRAKNGYATSHQLVLKMGLFFGNLIKTTVRSSKDPLSPLPYAARWAILTFIVIDACRVSSKYPRT